MNYKKKHIVIIAGEESGDKHGANLVNELIKKDRHITFSGIGGKKMKSSGVRIVYPSSLLSVVGLTEVITSLFDILKGLSTIRRHLLQTKPSLLILIDFPDFNFIVGSFAKKHGIKILYYISPQIWAWRSGRIKKIQKFVDQMAVILPFEENYYKKRGVDVTYVGHPLLDNNYQSQSVKQTPPCAKTEYTIGLLPGSRNKEINNLLPVMIQTAEMMVKKMDRLKFMIPVSNSVNKQNVMNILNTYQKHSSINLVYNDLNKVFNESKFLIASSGTVTLEAVIADVPLIIIYKISPISYKIGKYVVKINNFGLPNLIAGKEVIPELLQEDVNPETLSGLVMGYLNDSSKIDMMKKDFRKIRNKIGSSGASEKTANLALKMINH